VAESAIFLLAAWRGAVAATARAYAVNPQILGGERRRGRPITDPIYWEPRKLALYVTVLATGCTYAGLARVLGLHKDTVTSQCEEVRLWAASSPMMERRTIVLETRARARLAQELVGTFEEMGRAISWTFELAGVPEEAEDARRRVAILAGMHRAAATLGPDKPTENCGSLASEIITFPLSEAAE